METLDSSLYFTRNSQIFSLIDDQFAKALKAHWDSNFKLSLQFYSEYLKSYILGTSKTKDLAFSDYCLVCVKIGKPLPVDTFEESKNYNAKLIYYYAKFYWAFWIDHQIAFSCINKLFLNCFLSNCKQFIFTALFLYFHLKTIRTGRKTYFLLTKINYLIILYLIKNKLIKKNIVKDVVISAYPYTLFMAGVVKKNEIENVIDYAEKHVSDDPFYHSLILISGFYGCAYTGNIAKTEVYCERFRILQNIGKLKRYQPLTKIMRILPQALRGYCSLVKKEFYEILELHESSKYDHLVNSQFYRSAAIIALMLGNNKLAGKLVEIAKVERAKTKSFQAWSKIDDKIKKYSSSIEHFDPNKNRLLHSKIEYSAPPQLNSILISTFIEINSLVKHSVEELRIKLLNKLMLNLECGEYLIYPSIQMKVIDSPQMMLGGAMVVFPHVAQNRTEYIKEMLSVISPIYEKIISICEDIKEKERLEKKNLEMKEIEITNKIARQVAHDIKSPLTVLEVLGRSNEMWDGDKREMILTVSERIQEIASDLLASTKDATDKINELSISDKSMEIKNKQSSKKISFENTQYVPILNIYNSILRLVDSKRIEYSTKNVKLALYNNLCSPKIVRVNSRELIRVVSNLINNSMEAIKDEGLITLDLRNNDSFIFLDVRDTGKGIAAKNMNVIFKEGISINKKSGNGLGLSHAKFTIEKWDGKIKLSSQFKKGTLVTIQLPLMPRIPLRKNRVFEPSTAAPNTPFFYTS